MSVRLVAVVLGLVAAPALAQVDVGLARAYLPYEVGDTWEYDYERVQCAHQQTGGGCTTTTGTYTYRVVDTEVRGTDTLAVVEGPGTTTLYGVRSDSSGFAREVIEEADDAGPALFPIPSPGGFEELAEDGPKPVTFEVGGIEYSGECLCGDENHYVRGLGLSWFRVVSFGSGGQRSSETWELVGAAVGGQTYGLPVASEEAPGDVGLALSVGPNPTVGPLTVRVRLDTPASVRIVVADVLGRVVRTSASQAAAGSAVVPLDLSRLSQGLYVLRLIADGRPVGSTRVTVAGR